METKLPSTVLPPESVDAPFEEENLSLEAFLNGKSVMSIREIAAAELGSQPHRTAARKVFQPQLLELLRSKPRIVEDSLVLLDPVAWAVFTAACESPEGYVDTLLSVNMRPLFSRMLFFTHVAHVRVGLGKTVLDRVFVANEVRSMWRSEKERWTATYAATQCIDDYARAAANLYGAISIDELVGIVGAYEGVPEHGRPAFAEHCRAILDFRIRCGDPTYSVVNGQIVDNALADDEKRRIAAAGADGKDAAPEEAKLHALARRRNAYPRHVPATAQEFLEYADVAFAESIPALAELRRWLVAKCDLAAGEADDTLRDVYRVLQAGKTQFRAYWRCIRGNREKMSDGDRDGLRMRLETLRSSIRMACFNGRSADEVGAAFQPLEMAEEPEPAAAGAYQPSARIRQEKSRRTLFCESTAMRAANAAREAGASEPEAMNAYMEAYGKAKQYFNRNLADRIPHATGALTDEQRLAKAEAKLRYEERRAALMAEAEAKGLPSPFGRGTHANGERKRADKEPSTVNRRTILLQRNPPNTHPGRPGKSGKSGNSSLDELLCATSGKDGDASFQDDLPPPPLTVGRNDPCPCGSGKKYKNCCGA